MVYTVHFIVFPGAFVDFAVMPEVFAEATDFVVDEIALVDAAVCEVQFALAVLLAVGVHALVLGAIRPLLDA